MSEILSEMAGGGILQGVEGVVNAVGDQLNKKVEIQATQQSEELQANVIEETGQIEVNKVEASNINLFVSGWRPAAGWVCVFGFGYQMVVRNIFGWIMENLFHWTLPPNLDIQTLMTLLFGLLGLGGYRMAEKIKGVASK